eukprot:10370347-Alexandrium_andersonii.AAC.1
MSTRARMASPASCQGKPEMARGRQKGSERAWRGPPSPRLQAPTSSGDALSPQTPGLASPDTGNWRGRREHGAGSLRLPQG